MYCGAEVKLFYLGIFLVSTSTLGHLSTRRISKVPWLHCWSVWLLIFWERRLNASGKSSAREMAGTKYNRKILHDSDNAISRRWFQFASSCSQRFYHDTWILRLISLRITGKSYPQVAGPEDIRGFVILSQRLAWRDIGICFRKLKKSHLSS